MTSRAIVQDGYNKENLLSTLKIVTRPISRAGPNQVVVRIMARPINPTDFLSMRNGLVGGNGYDTIGSEGCGVVHETLACIPEGVTAVQKGRVVTITSTEVFKGNGAFQEYILLDSSLVWPVPSDMSDEKAAQFVINPWISYSMLHGLQALKGEYIIQSAAGSTLRKQVISLASHYGLGNCKAGQVIKNNCSDRTYRAVGQQGWY